MKLLAHIGTYFLLMKRAFGQPEKYSILYRQVMREIEKVGINSFGIIVIISIFVGAVITIQVNFRDPVICNRYSKPGINRIG